MAMTRDRADLHSGLAHPAERRLHDADVVAIRAAAARAEAERSRIVTAVIPKAPRRKGAGPVASAAEALLNEQAPTADAHPQVLPSHRPSEHSHEHFIEELTHPKPKSAARRSLIAGIAAITLSPLPLLAVAPGVYAIYLANQAQRELVDEENAFAPREVEATAGMLAGITAVAITVVLWVGLGLGWVLGI